MNVIDLFREQVDFQQGLKAGLDIIMANEIDEMIAETYKNHKDTLMINLDIKELAQNFDEIVSRSLEEFDDNERKSEIKRKLKQVDIIIGGPPCQALVWLVQE